jgi:hypothetical protein
MRATTPNRGSGANSGAARISPVSAFFFDSDLDFLTRQFHDNAINLAVVFGSVVTGKYSDDLIHISEGNLSLAIHLLTM